MPVRAIGPEPVIQWRISMRLEKPTGDQAPGLDLGCKCANQLWLQ